MLVFHEKNHQLFDFDSFAVFKSHHNYYQLVLCCENNDYALCIVLSRVHYALPIPYVRYGC
jgi:hypothetical protein